MKTPFPIPVALAPPDAPDRREREEAQPSVAAAQSGRPGRLSWRRGGILASRVAGNMAGWLKGWFEPGRFVAPAVPKLSIETTNVCNSDCVFCANSAMTRRKSLLPMDRFRKVVDEFVDMGGQELDFNVTIGDPLLDRRLLERARYARSRHASRTLGFVTTLQWLHRFPIDDFFDAGFTWIGVSTVLSGRQRYREFFGVDQYDRMLENLLRLLRENRARGKPMFVGVDVKPTDEPIEEVVRHPDFLAVAALSEEDLAQKVRQRGFFFDDWQGAVKLPPYLRRRPLYPRAFRPCRLLYKGLVVYSGGQVGACQCRDYEADSTLILGTIDEGSLGQFWNGEKLAAIRRNWRLWNRIPAICRSCRHYLM